MNKEQAAELKAKDPEYFRKLAVLANKSWKEGGRKPRGFAYDRELARIAGAKGGRKSRKKG